MDKLKVLDWTIEIDREKTIEYYKSIPYVKELCECDNCLKFENACEFINDEVRELFNKLGLDIKKSQELFYCTDNDDGTCLYWAFCDIIGNIIQGKDCIITDRTPKNKETGLSETFISHPVLIPYIEGFNIGFNKRQDLEYKGIKYEAICLQFEGVFKRVI